MKKNQKLLALFLSVLMILPLASCAESTSNDETTPTVNTPSTEENIVSEEVTAEERLPLGVPTTADFGGLEICFLVWDGWAGTVRQYRDIYAEALTGEAINDAVYNRNLLLQENYNVTIMQERASSSIDTTVKESVASGDTTYSVIYPRLVESKGLYQQNFFHNLLELDNIDLTQPWWDNNCVDSLSVMGMLRAVATSINVNDKDATAAVAFNKTIAANNNLEDIYSLVREGKWTYDKCAELADVCDYDANGDGKLSEDDVYGFLGKNDVMTAFWFGAGSKMMGKDENDIFVFTFGSERDINSSSKVIEFMNQPWFYNHQTAGIGDDEYRILFETGHGLFFWMRLDEVTNMRNGEADFGILPTPKYEESQDNYYSFVSQHTTGLMSLPITLIGDHLNAVTTVLEAMAYESHYTLIPVYIESSLKTKHSRDAESADMIDIIISNRVFDPMVIYGFGGFADTFQGFGSNPNANIASRLATLKKPIDKTLKVFLEKMEAQK